MAKEVKGIEGKFEVVGVVPGVVVSHRHGTIDLRTISLAEAEKLHAAGFRYLKKVEKAPEAAEEAKAEKRKK